jgi:hypothetical protein
MMLNSGCNVPAPGEEEGSDRLSLYFGLGTMIDLQACFFGKYSTHVGVDHCPWVMAWQQGLPWPAGAIFRFTCEDSAGLERAARPGPCLSSISRLVTALRSLLPRSGPSVAGAVACAFKPCKMRWRRSLFARMLCWPDRLRERVASD